MIVLGSETALEGSDLTLAFEHVKQTVEVTARFRKKEDILQMSKSILKHRIQTLTGKNIRKIEEEMDYKPVDPNETGMNLEVMQKLAHCLILLANGELKAIRSAPAPAPPTAAIERSQKPLDLVQNPGSALKRSGSELDAEMPKSKLSRRSVAGTPRLVDTPDSGTPTRRGRKSIATPLVSESTPSRLSRRSTAVVPPPTSRSAVDSLNETASTGVSVAPRCLGPANGIQENLQNLAEEEEEEDMGLSNPTPAMRDLMNKRKSLGAAASARKTKLSPVKKPVVKPAPAPAPAQPRQEFLGTGGSKVFLLAGDPMQLMLEKLTRRIPLSAHFPGAHLTVVHTPADWTATEMFQITKRIKTFNRSAGLDTFVLLLGTGLTNVHLNQEAILKHTQHVQFVTFHREDANLTVETGKLRETTSFFLVGYFFPGCEKEGSNPPTKMVRTGYSTCFRTENIESLETSIIDCFSEQGEWVMDLYCGKRKLTLAAAERGRNAVAVNIDGSLLEELGNFLRTLSLREDTTYRGEDGLVGQL